MVLIQYTETFRALDRYIKRHNEDQKKLSDCVRQATASTARDIIRIYGLFLAKANSVQELDINNLPPLRTNNVQLAGMGNASRRTIQRHIGRLMDAGIILKKKWHGTNSSYELWLNPKVIRVGKKPDKEVVEKRLKERFDRSDEYDRNNEGPEGLTTGCPHSDSGYNSYAFNNLLIAGENVENPPEKESSGEVSGYASGHEKKRSSLSLTGKSDSGYAVSGHTGEKAGKISGGAAEEAGEKVRAKRAGGQETGEVKSPRTDPARSASLNWYVMMLWNLAKNTIYRNTYLTERQVQRAQELLYLWYEPVADDKLQAVHQVYVERMGLVRKFVERDPNRRFVQLPNRYFDPDNPSGFRGSRKWWQLDQKQKIQVRAKLILHAQIRRYVLNQQKPPHKQKPPLELYRQCEMRVSKLRKPELLDQFHAAVLDPASYGQLRTGVC